MSRSRTRSPFVPLAALLSLGACAPGGDSADAVSPEALAAYESGREALERRRGRADADAALAGFERAVEADSEFADAWSGIAQARMWLLQNFGETGQLAGAEAAAARARELAPNASETHLALGYVAYWGKADFDGALAHFQAAESIDDGNAAVAGAIGNIYRRKGQLDEALRYYERRIEIDPSLGQGNATLAGTYAAVGRYDAAAEVADRLLAQGDGRGHVWKFWAHFHSGDTATAWTHIAGIQEAQGRAGQPGYFALLQALARRDNAATNQLIDQIGTDVGGGLRVLIAEHAGSTGQADAFSEAFDAWIEDRASGLVEAPSTPRARLQQAGRLSEMAYLEAYRGNGEVAMRHAAAVMELDPRSIDAWGGVTPIINVSSAHLALDHDRPALDVLEELAAIRRGPSTGWMQFSPVFDPVRDTERFESMIEARGAMEQRVR